MNKRDQYILIVDDTAIDAFIAKKIINLVCPTMIVKHVSSGDVALKILNSKVFRPFLVFLDIDMPEMSGIEVLNNLDWSKEEKERSIVILSSSQNPADKSQCYDQGILQFIEKPLSVEKYKKCELIESE